MCWKCDAIAVKCPNITLPDWMYRSLGPPPPTKRRQMAYAAAIRGKALFSTAELRVKAEAARQRRVEAGISDPVENMQPVKSPAFDQSLVGKWLEVRWKYTNKDTGEPEYIWSTGKVVRVADGLADKRSARAKKILPAGALLWAWEADADFEEKAGEQWLILLPDKVEQAGAVRLAL